MLKRKFMAFCMALLAFSGSAQVTQPESQASGVTTVSEAVEQTPKKESDSSSFHSMFGISYHRFNTKANLYGVNWTFIRPGKFAGELAYQTNFKEHAMHKIDFGINYSFRLYDEDDIRVFLIPTIGPIFRIVDEYKRTEVTERKTYSTIFGEQIKRTEHQIYGKGYYFDGYFSARLALIYKSAALSAGYYMYSPKFKFKDKALSHGAVVSLFYFM